MVLPGDLNHYGYLFGGNLLKWVDEYCWIAASIDYPDCAFVTIGLDKVEFRHGVREGSILRFNIELLKEGVSSVTYQANVYRRAFECCEDVHVFSTNATLVNVDEQGKKRAINKL